MRDMNFKPLTDEDRKRNKYLDKVNHAPYSSIFLIILGMLLLFTVGALLSAF
ncbi:MAG: hypothetical protein RMY34_14345 [Aulosira sp. DedQUE10]|nr:hypothetical protein [Aulosira sp. DedQUE10]